MGIHLSDCRCVPPTGRFHVGNCGHDSIACYAVDQVTGLLTLAGLCPSGGKCPRNFNVDTTGRWMIVGNQDSNLLSIFKIDHQTGLCSLAS